MMTLNQLHGVQGPPPQLGYAWLAPLISGVVQGQQQASGDASDIFGRAQVATAQHRAAQERQDTIARLATIGGVVLFLGFGGWALYRLTKD